MNSSKSSNKIYIIYKYILNSFLLTIIIHVYLFKSSIKYTYNIYKYRG